MNNTSVTITEMLTSDQFVELIKFLVTGAVILSLAYGAYKNGYTLEARFEGVDIALRPASIEK